MPVLKRFGHQQEPRERSIFEPSFVRTTKCSPVERAPKINLSNFVTYASLLRGWIHRSEYTVFKYREPDN